MSRRFVYLAVFTLWIAGCGEPQLAFSPPLLMDTAGLGQQIEIEGPALVLGTPRDSTFSSTFTFKGHFFAAPRGATLDLSMQPTSPETDSALMLYGPRSRQGLFGAALGHDLARGGAPARIDAFEVPDEGDYLVLTANLGAAGGGYRLLVSCLDGCDEPPACEAQICGIYCATGLARDEESCPLCYCAPGCTDHSDCPLGFDCDAGICRLASDCECDGQSYDPVCGVDGQTYANDCERDCAGVALDHAGACDAPGCASDSDCAAGHVCENGLCVSACDCSAHGYDPVCGTDGRTYANDCERQCALVGLKHQGPCDQCNPEVCDGVDNDCDGVVDEGCGLPCSSDSDCPAGKFCWGGTCVGVMPCTSDADCPVGQLCQDGICVGEPGCDPEICDGIDNDCDGYVDEGCPACRGDSDCAPGEHCDVQTGTCVAQCADADGDGYDSCEGDCDDLDPATHPGAAEACEDNTDNDCDGLVDEGCPGGPCTSDADCPAGQVCLGGLCTAVACTTSADCEDGDPCTLDSCMNGVCLHDAAADGTACDDGSACTSNDTCQNGACVGVSTDADGDGYPACAGDCDDFDAGIHPGAQEICDNQDNDCDGQIDEGCPAGCTTDGDCAAGQACCASFCVDILSDPQNCGGCGTQSSAGESCASGICTGAACATDADCDDADPGTWDFCADGVCVYIDTCSTDSDCSVGNICFSGYCVGNGSCSSDSDCDAGEYCQQGACLLECRTNDDCSPASVCVGGVPGYCAP